MRVTKRIVVEIYLNRSDKAVTQIPRDKLEINALHTPTRGDRPKDRVHLLFEALKLPRGYHRPESMQGVRDESGVTQAREVYGELASVGCTEDHINTLTEPRAWTSATNNLKTSAT